MEENCLAGHNSRRFVEPKEEQDEEEKL